MRSCEEGATVFVGANKRDKKGFKLSNYHIFRRNVAGNGYSVLSPVLRLFILA